MDAIVEHETRKADTTPGAQAEPERCTSGQAHRWLIDEPHGPTSKATCKHCGAMRIYRNWLIETDIITNAEHRMTEAA